MKEVKGKQSVSDDRENEAVVQEPMGKSQRLSELRQEIDQLDEALVELLVKRFAAVTEIAGIKEKSGLAIFDENREREILLAVSKQLKDSQVETEILEVFSAMLLSSKKAQAKLLGRK